MRKFEPEQVQSERVVKSTNHLTTHWAEFDKIFLTHFPYSKAVITNSKAKTTKKHQHIAPSAQKVVRNTMTF